MLYASFLNLVLNIFFNYTLVKRYGINGLAIATTSVSIINFIILFLFVRYQQKKEFSQ
jgi:Na+-driven multidrug efflux pump